MRHLPRILSALALTLSACAGEEGPTYHQDVRPILEGRCVSCHADGKIAPFSLEEYAAVKSFGTAVAQAVTSRQMPPWSAGDSQVTYRGDVSLSDEQIQLVTDWVSGGMPEGDPDEPGEALPSVETPFPGTDLELQLPVPYVPIVRPDDYRCFPVEWTETEDKFVTALNVIPGNLKIVHHVAVSSFRPRTRTSRTSGTRRTRKRATSASADRRAGVTRSRSCSSALGSRGRPAMSTRTTSVSA